MGQKMGTAAGWLNDLNTHFTPTTTQFSGARGHRESIEARLNRDLGVAEMFEIGSLRHGTGVSSYSDADYLVVLKGFRPDNPWTMLNKVKASLVDRFQFTSIGTRRPAVVCRFGDGIVEVVPAYARTSGGGYWIADPTGGWMLTYPKHHNSWVNEVNTAHGGSAKKLARQLKIWKYRRNVPVSSCYLEMRAAKHMEGERSYHSTWDLQAVLRKLQDNSLAAMNDPTGLGSRFTAYSSEANKQDALSKLSRAVTRAQRAHDYAQAGDHMNAVAQLRLLFDR